MKNTLSKISQFSLLMIPLAMMACSSGPQVRSLSGGKLESCPGSPNCIQSEYPDDEPHYFAPLDISSYTIARETPKMPTGAQDSTYDTAASEPTPVELPAELDVPKVYSKVLNTIEAMEGRIIKQDSLHIHATFTSKIMRYVDDFEVRIDDKEMKLFLRSASRVGYSDMGVNRERAEKFQSEFNK